MKAMNVLTLIFAGLTLLSVMLYNNAVDYQSAVGWGLILSLWSIAYAITVMVKSKKTI